MNILIKNRASILSGMAAAFILFLAVAGMMATSCRNKSRAQKEPASGGQNTEQNALEVPEKEPPYAKIPVSIAIPISGFFQFLDDIVRQNDTLDAYRLTENLLLRANPWILDTLVHTDYYYQMSLGHFVFDQRQMVVLNPGDTLLIPGPRTGAALQEKMLRTWLDINIPAFQLRIMDGDSVLYKIPVRVGKNQKKYLEMAGRRRVDLRTRTGSGEIIRVNRTPVFFDPVTGEKFKFTKRDDRKTTYMPQIPWLEPSINGGRYGQMIHPTTNPRTLGRPASNGCIGVSEADGWRVYVFAPLGTKVVIRYDLQEINEQGDTLNYQDVYRLHRDGKVAGLAAGIGIIPEKTTGICVCDSMF